MQDVASKKARIDEHFRPERKVTGIARDNQRIVLFTQIAAVVQPSMQVLDFGAGRGRHVGALQGFASELTLLKGKVRKLVGVDIDPVVLDNPGLDEALVVDKDAKLPFDDNSFDLIISLAVFEHVECPERVAAELTRVLKPGGYLFAWTPNKWGLVGIGGRLVPNWLHVKFLKFFLPLKKEIDTFPTFYRMNTLSRIRSLFPSPPFDNGSYLFNGPPTYHGNSFAFATVLSFAQWILPPAMGKQLHIILRKTAGRELAD